MRCERTELRHADDRERLIDAAPDFLRRHAEILRAECHVILDDGGDELVVGILEHHADLLPDAPDLVDILRIHAVDAADAARRQQQRVEVLCKRRLARAVRAEHGDKFSRLDGERDIRERPVLVFLARMVDMREAVEFYESHKHSFLS